VFLCFLTRASMSVRVCYFVFLCIVWLLFGFQFQCSQLPGKIRSLSNLLCVEWDIKLYSLTHSYTTVTTQLLLNHYSLTPIKRTCPSVVSRSPKSQHIAIYAPLHIISWPFCDIVSALTVVGHLLSLVRWRSTLWSARSLCQHSNPWIVSLKIHLFSACQHV